MQLCLPLKYLSYLFFPSHPCCYLPRCGSYHLKEGMVREIGKLRGCASRKEESWLALSSVTEAAVSARFKRKNIPFVDQEIIGSLLKLWCQVHIWPALIRWTTQRSLNDCRISGTTYRLILTSVESVLWRPRFLRLPFPLILLCGLSEFYHALTTHN